LLFGLNDNIESSKILKNTSVVSCINFGIILRNWWYPNCRKGEIQTPDMVYCHHKENLMFTPLKCKPQAELKNVLVIHGQDEHKNCQHFLGRYIQNKICLELTFTGLFIGKFTGLNFSRL